MSGWDPAPKPSAEYAKRRYPLIDNDPHFSRVVSYFRPSDYAVLGATAVGFPIGLVWIERYLFPRSRVSGRPEPTLYNLRFPLVVAAVLGAWGGFLTAYSLSSFRFMGLKENRREYERDYIEMSARIKAGMMPYGEPSKGSESSLRAAHYNSMNSQFNLAIIPWFNLINHPWHGRNLEDYSRPCDWQAAWEAANAGKLNVI